jgi:hypothetical protein
MELATGNIANAELTIPTTLVLGGISYDIRSTPELALFVDTVQKVIAKTEKTKLYSQIQSLQEAVKKLEKVDVTPSNTASTDLDSFKTGLLSEIDDRLKKYTDPIVQKQLQQDKEDVISYRNRLLMENQDVIIPELVVGNTKAELDIALAASKEIFAKYGTPKMRGTSTTTNSLPPVNVTKNTEATNVPVKETPKEEPLLETKTLVTPSVNNIPDIGQMSMEDFAKQRALLKKQVEGLV